MEKYWWKPKWNEMIWNSIDMYWAWPMKLYMTIELTVLKPNNVKYNDEEIWNDMQYYENDNMKIENMVMKVYWQ